MVSEVEKREKKGFTSSSASENDEELLFSSINQSKIMFENITGFFFFLC